MDLRWTSKKFDDLTPHELYAIMRLRIEVFIVEQNCVFLDADGKDQHCHHFMGWRDDALAAYSRLMPAAIAYDNVSIGRVVTSPKNRMKGFGRELMMRSIAECRILYGKKPIQIGAQLYLKKFYESMGFKQSGLIYIEDGIDHIEMILV